MKKLVSPFAFKMTLMYCENLLLKIRRNEIDQFEIIAESQKFGINISSESFSRQKYKLECCVLKEILKVKDGWEREKYESLLENIKKLLEVGASPKPKGYPCTFLGCLFTSCRHRDYVKHLERIHPSSETYRCFFQQKCLRNFTTISDLKEHFKTSHTKGSSHSAEVATASQLVEHSCKCNMLSCGEQIFQSSKELASHINKVHKKEPRMCIFKDCENKFVANSESRFHFQKAHFKTDLVTLKDVHLLGSISSIPTFGNRDEVIGLDSSDMQSDENSEGSSDDENDADTEEDDHDEEKHYMMAYSDFLNRLINYKFIPISSVQDISSEYLKHSHQSSQSREAVLRKSLSKVPNISDEVLEEIVHENMKDPFVKAQEELASEFKRKAYLEDNFKLVKPKEIVLNPEEVKQGARKDVVHYIPLLEAFRNLVEDKSFITALENARNDARVGDGQIEDVTDGSAYKESKYFKDNPDAHALMMYSDGVELTNPLASGRGKHKIVQLFWQVCEIPRFQRSTIDRLQLGLVFKEKLLKKYKYSTILKELVEDLAFLEREGVEVNEPVPRRVKASLLLYSGDNLESHIVGGFSASFSSKDICRHCHCQYNDLQDHINNFDGESCHQPWTVLEYDSHQCQEDDDGDDDEILPDVELQAADILENIFTEYEEPADDEVVEGAQPDSEANLVNFGVKSKCVFNKLESFHCITSMPPDSMHDLMEGVLPQDLLGIIRILILKQWFSLENYNKALKTLKYSPRESANKPQEVPSSNKTKKLSGKATSNWVHVRNFPLLLFLNDWILDEADDVFKLALMLHDVTERITAESFRSHEIETLENLLLDYYELRKAVFNEYPVLGGTKGSFPIKKVRNFGLGAK